MKIIKSSFNIEDPVCGHGINILRRIEEAGRTCYKSEDLNVDFDKEKTKKFVRMILDRGHESVLEHEKITVRIICDRGILAELTRHRICSFSVESTRYCNYSKNKFNNEITFIDITPFLDSSEAKDIWMVSLRVAEQNYMDLLSHGVPPEIARSILPNSLKTEIVVTANIREWRHILKLRTSKAAHPQMRQIMIPLLHELQDRIPIVFDDIKEDT